MLRVSYRGDPSPVNSVLRLRLALLLILWCTPANHLVVRLCHELLHLGCGDHVLNHLLLKLLEIWRMSSDGVDWHVFLGRLGLSSELRVAALFLFISLFKLGALLLPHRWLLYIYVDILMYFLNVNTLLTSSNNLLGFLDERIGLLENLATVLTWEARWISSFVSDGFPCERPLLLVLLAYFVNRRDEEGLLGRAFGF